MFPAEHDREPAGDRKLARTYAMAGKSADALKTYQRVVDEFPQSVFAAAARREIEIAKIPGAN